MCDALPIKHHPRATNSRTQRTALRTAKDADRVNIQKSNRINPALGANPH